MEDHLSIRHSQITISKYYGAKAIFYAYNYLGLLKATDHLNHNMVAINNHRPLKGHTDTLTLHHSNMAAIMVSHRINHNMVTLVCGTERCCLPMLTWNIAPPTVHQNAYANGNQNAPPPPPTGLQGFGGGAPQGYAFQYSNCTGRRKALLIGINYFGQRGQLRGCINDVKNMSAFLNENFGYQRDDMVLLTDDQQNPMSQPTKQNILRAMHWLVKDARPNDSLFFHYSGM
jgi:hypothetical protein